MNMEKNILLPAILVAGVLGISTCFSAFAFEIAIVNNSGGSMGFYMRNYAGSAIQNPIIVEAHQTGFIGPWDINANKQQQSTLGIGGAKNGAELCKNYAILLTGKGTNPNKVVQSITKTRSFQFTFQCA